MVYEIIDITLQSYISKSILYMSCIQEGITKSQWYMQGSKKTNQITLSSEYAHLIDTFMKERKLKRPTVKQIQAYLSEEQLMNSILSYSIRRILKFKLGLSLKKHCSIEYNSTTGLNIRKFMESTMLRLTLENEGI